jgi:hypothetical protein
MFMNETGLAVARRPGYVYGNAGNSPRGSGGIKTLILLNAASRHLLLISSAASTAIGIYEICQRFGMGDAGKVATAMVFCGIVLLALILALTLYIPRPER